MDRQSIQRISKKCIEFGFYALIFFLPISKALVESFAGFIVFFYMISKIACRDFSIFGREKRIFWLLLAIFVFSALSLVNSGPLLAKGLRTLLCKWAEYLLLFIITIDYFRDQKKIIRLFLLMALSVSLVGLSALTQKFFGFEFLRQRPMAGVAVTGPFESPNSLSVYLVCCLPLVIAFASWPWPRKRWNMLFVGVGGVCVSALLLTYSRAGWVGLIASIFLLVGVSRRKIFPAAALAGFGLSLALFAPFAQRLMQTFVDGGDSQRLLFWQGTWAMIKDAPLLGKGLGTYMDHFARYVPDVGVYYAHNSYLQMWAETGVLALAAFLSLMGVVLFYGIRGARVCRDDEQSLLAGGLSAGVLGFLVAAFFDNGLYVLQLSLLFWVMAGAAVATRRCFPVKE